MMRSSLYDYSDACILAKEPNTIIEPGADAPPRQRDERNKQVMFKNYAPFTDYVIKIKNTQIYNIKDTNIVMSILQ